MIASCLRFFEQQLHPDINATEHQSHRRMKSTTFILVLNIYPFSKAVRVIFFFKKKKINPLWNWKVSVSTTSVFTFLDRSKTPPKNCSCELQAWVCTKLSKHLETELECNSGSCLRHCYPAPCSWVSLRWWEGLSYLQFTKFKNTNCLIYSKYRESSVIRICIILNAVAVWL